MVVHFKFGECGCVMWAEFAFNVAQKFSACEISGKLTCQSYIFSIPQSPSYCITSWSVCQDATSCWKIWPCVFSKVIVWNLKIQHFVNSCVLWESNLVPNAMIGKATPLNWEGVLWCLCVSRLGGIRARSMVHFCWSSTQKLLLSLQGTVDHLSRD